MMPRLLVVTACGEVSGAERVLLDVVEAATGAGWTVLCAAPPGPIVEELRAAGCRCSRRPGAGDAHLGAARARGLGRLVRWGRAAALVRRAADRADVVLVNSLGGLPVVRLRSSGAAGRLAGARRARARRPPRGLPRSAGRRWRGSRRVRCGPAGSPGT